VSSDPKLPKNVGRFMIGIVIGFALVALYANIQKLRRSAIETVVFTPGLPHPQKPKLSPTPTATP